MTFQQQVRGRRPPNGKGDSTTTRFGRKSHVKQTLRATKASIWKDTSKRKTANIFIKHSIHILHQQWKSLSRSPGALVMHTLHNTLHLTAQKKESVFGGSILAQLQSSVKIQCLKYILQHISSIVKFTLWPHYGIACWQQQSQSTVPDLKEIPLCGRNGDGAVLLFAIFFLTWLCANWTG